MNEEQTASLVSFFLYFFLDSIITAAWRVPHLPADQLPVLADYDWAEHLVKKSFPYLDPFQGAKRGRNLFWGFCVTFKGELTKQFMIVLGAVGAATDPEECLITYNICMLGNYKDRPAHWDIQASEVLPQTDVC